MLAYFGPVFLKPFGVYINLITFFHFSEFFLTAIINSESLNLDSYLLQNGNPYYIALLVSWAEYFIEVYYFKEYKYLSYLSIFGITLSLVGELFRKSAMVGVLESNLWSVFKKRDLLILSFNLILVDCWRQL